MSDPRSPDLEVDLPLLRAPRLLADGQNVPRRRTQYHLSMRDGSTRELMLKRGAVDPVPTVVDGDQTIRLAPPLAAWEWVLAALPLTLVFIGGLVGGLLGVATSVIVVRVLRLQIPPAARLSLGLLATLLAYAIFFVVTTLVLLILHR